MPKYIDIEDILFPRPIPAKQRRYDFGYARGWNAALEFAQIVPAADVQPVVRAKWIPHNNPMFSPFDDTEEHLYQCSACFAFRPHRENFCPNCGAKMEKES